MRRWYGLLLSFATLAATARLTAAAGPVDALHAYADHLNEAVTDHYADPDAPADPVAVPQDLLDALDPTLARSLRDTAAGPADLSERVGVLRATLDQAVALKVADAVGRGDLAAAKAWRCELGLPRGVSAAEGTLLLEQLGGDPAKRADAVRLLTREAITWETTRVRQLLAESGRAVKDPEPMPGRLAESLGEATTLARLPAPLAKAAGLDEYRAPPSRDAELASLEKDDWSAVAAAYAPVRHAIETSLPSLLTDQEKARRERLLLKLVVLIPREYGSGVRDGKVTVPLEYREAVAFNAQARQLLGELAPLWLAETDAKAAAVDKVDRHLTEADAKIAAKATVDDVSASLNGAEKALENDLGISLARRGTTADIVDEVMLETRGLLNQSFAAAVSGDFKTADQHRLEAYTTYDPDLEARLMPRDPQLATDIEHLMLDGLDQPGIKVLLDEHKSGPELEAAYARVNEALGRAAVQLKSGVSPSAAFVNASSIVLREGLEGLLVIIAIFAGLRGEQHARRRRLFWVGILASVVVTGLTWVLSQTLITSLRSYGEVIEAVTGVIAIGVLLLITNWLFQQVYWKQWITSLKTQAQSEDESTWTLIMVGFAVGYREGFETVLFLQSLVLDAGGTAVGFGVLFGCVVLVALGFASLKLGLKMPYFKLLMLTAGLIGMVLITFTGTTVRALQTVGWIPVHKLTGGSWPIWTGNWLGLYNTWESIGGQLVAGTIVIGTWRVARWQSKRKSQQRRAAVAANNACRVDAATDHLVHCAPEGCSTNCATDCDVQVPSAAPLVRVTVSPNVRQAAARDREAVGQPR